MKRLFSATAALFLAAVMTVQSFAIGFSPEFLPENMPENIPSPAESGPNISSSAPFDYGVTADTSFGSLLAQDLTAEVESVAEDNGNKVFSVEISNQLATVEYQCSDYATLVVAVYDEDSGNISATASTEVSGPGGYVDLMFESKLPRYFIVRAYLIDSLNMRPLCRMYESPNYTREMQEFFAKTVDDFAPDRVLNLDGDPTNNFAVYGADVLRIPYSEGLNLLLTGENGIYVFENPDSVLSGMQPGQVFACEYAPGEVIIARVGSISQSGDMLTITEGDIEMTDAFEFVRIEASAGLENAIVDTTPIDGSDEVKFLGMIDRNGVGEEGIAPMELSYEQDVSGSIGTSFQVNLLKLGGDDSTVKASVKGKFDLFLKPELKYYVSFSKQYIEFNVNYEIGASLEVKGTAKDSVPLANFFIPLVPGVDAFVEPEIVIEYSASISYSNKIKGSFGVSNETGVIKPNNKNPKFEDKLELEGKIFIGLKAKVGAEALKGKVVKVSLNVEGGLEATATATLEELPPDEKHDCLYCYEGHVEAKRSIEYEIKFLDTGALTLKGTIAEIKWPIPALDFYYCLEHGDGGFGECPYKTYQAKVKVSDNTYVVSDSAFIPIDHATVTVNGQKYKTNKDGEINDIFLRSGTYTIVCMTDGYDSAEEKIKIDGEPYDGEIIFRLCKEFNESDIKVPLTGKPMFWEWNGESGGHAFLTASGDLYTWGGPQGGMYGELGHGFLTTATGSMVSYIPDPKLLLRNVADVQYCDGTMAAITVDGKLFMWGSNKNYRLATRQADNLGDRKNGYLTPQFIMDDVASISMGGWSVAVITNSGDLYMWGDTIRLDSDLPIYEKKLIMRGVKSFKALALANGVLTQDNSLYLWGSNTRGIFLTGRASPNEKFNTDPVKIMDGVVDFGGYDAGMYAIKEDGSMYVWGTIGGYATADEELIKNGERLELYDEPMLLFEGVEKCLTHSDTNCAVLMKNGDLYYWGNNNKYQACDISEDPIYTPTKIMSDVRWANFGNHTEIITNDNKLYICGECRDSTKVSIYEMTYVTTRKLALENVDFIFSGTVFYLATLNGDIYNYAPLADFSRFNPRKDDELSELNNPDGESLTSFDFQDPLSDGIYSIYGISPLNADGPGLLPNEIYNIYGMKSRSAKDHFGSDNLLYIIQAETDEFGILNYDYSQVEPYANPDIFFRSMTDFSLANAEISGAYATSDSITLRWKPYPGASMYRVYRVSNGFFLNVGETTETTLTVEGLSPENEYGFLVTCCVNGEWSERRLSDVVYVSTGGETLLRGDVNGDGEVSLDDAILTLKFAMNVDMGDSIFIEAVADVTGDDDAITLDDAVTILKIAMNVEA